MQCLAFSPCTLHDVHISSRCHSKSAISLADKNDNVEEVREGSLRAATKELGKVPYGEISRKYRRTVYRHDDWVTHRSSSSRILNNLQSMFFSGVVRQLRPQVTVVTSVAALVLTWNCIIVNSDASALQNIDLHAISLPMLPFTLSSPPLGLLLVFRTNAAYARWMIARDAWSRMGRHGTNLVRMGSIFSQDVEAVDELSKFVWLYCRSVMNRLSSPAEDEEVYQKEVREILGDDSPIAENIISSPDRTISAWKQLSIQLHSLPTSDPKTLIETDKSIIILGECTSICERIYSSPVPLVYTRHTQRFLSLWVLLLPCALCPAFSSAGEVWAVLPASAIMAFFLFGVDELAMQLEEPFSILPMRHFCDELMKANKIMVGKEEMSFEKNVNGKVPMGTKS